MANLTLSANADTLLACADFSAMRTALSLVPGTNVQAYNAGLAAIAGLTSAADALPYFSGSGTASTTTLTSFSRTLLDDTTPAAWRSTLKVPASDPTGITGATGIGNIVSIPQADYDAIGSPDSAIWYVIPNGYMADYGAFVIGEWVADTSATDATGLAAGEVRRNNATPASITELYLDSITKGAVDQTTLLKLLASGAKLLLQEFDAAANFQLFSISGTPSVSSGNWTIPVTLDSSGGEGSTGFADGTRLLVATRASSTGGGSGDIVSDLTSAEISVTGATTATISRMHVCSGTTADYTLTLPAASGNAGKMIGVRMATGLTKLVTIDANSTELIDGSQTRIMWAGESAILLCDGTGWAKISGKSRPMVADSRRNTSLTITNATATHVSLNNDQTSSVAAMIASGSLVALRPGKYAIDALVTYEASGANPGFESYCIASINDNVYTGFAGVARLSVVPTSTNTTDTYAHPAVSSSLTLAAGDTVSLVAYQNTGGSMATRTAIQGVYPYLRITESPDW